MTYTASLSNKGAFYYRDGDPITREEFEAALLAMPKRVRVVMPDVCEWRELDGVRFKRSCTTYPTLNAHGPYCANCGGKIVVEAS